MRDVKRHAVALCAVLLAFGACGSEDPGSGAAGGHDHSGHTHPTNFSFGEPADGTLIDRTVTVTAKDDPFRFEPDSLEIEVGQIVEFEFINDGGTLHEFVLLEQASEDPAAGAHEHTTDPNATPRLEPGESGSVAWKFTAPGEFVYECHVDGHHLGGMRGTITVTEG